MCNIENAYIRWISENWEKIVEILSMKSYVWNYLYRILIAYIFSNISKVLTCINYEGVWNPIFCLSVILLSGKLCSGYILKQNCQIVGLRCMCVFWNNLIKHFSSTYFVTRFLHNSYVFCWIHYFPIQTSILYLSSTSCIIFTMCKGIFCAYQLKYSIWF